MRLSEFAFIRDSEWRAIAEQAITEYWGDGSPKFAFNSLRYYCEANFEIGQNQPGQLYTDPDGQFAVWRIGHLISQDGRPLYLYFTKNPLEGNNQPYRSNQVLQASAHGSVLLKRRLTPEQEQQISELRGGPGYPDLTYHADYHIEIDDMEHLVLEHPDRLKKVLPTLDGKTRVWEHILTAALNEAHGFAAHRDIAVPQYHIPGYGARDPQDQLPGSFQHLLPLYITTRINLATRPDLVAAMEANHARRVYMVKTLLYPEWAYRTARCIARDNARIRAWNPDPAMNVPQPDKDQRGKSGPGASGRRPQPSAQTHSPRPAVAAVAVAVAAPPASNPAVPAQVARPALAQVVAAQTAPLAAPPAPEIAQAAPIEVAQPAAPTPAVAQAVPAPTDQTAAPGAPADLEEQDAMAQTIERFPKGVSAPNPAAPAAASPPASNGQVAVASLPVPPSLPKEEWVTRASRHYNAKEYPEALTALKQALAIDPNYALAHLYQGYTHYAMNAPEEAVRAYDAAIQCKADYWEAYFFKGEILRSQAEKQNNQEQGREALAAYEQVIKLHPDYAPAYLSKAYSLRFLQDYAGALAACEIALRLQQTSVDARTFQAYLLRKLQRFAEALAAYNALLKDYPNHEPARQGREKVVQEIQALSNARAGYQQAVAKWPNDPPSWYRLGEVCEKLGLQAEAQQAFQRARELGFNH